MSAESSETTASEPNSAGDRPQIRLRIWPAIVFAALIVIGHVWAVTGESSPEKFQFGLFLTPLIAFVGMLIWWMFFSRLPWSERWLGLGILVATIVAIIVLADPTFRGVVMIFYVVPILVLFWTGWLLLSALFPWSVRRGGMIGLFVAVGIVSCLVRLNGMWGSFDPDFSWRWSTTAEQRHLAMLKSSSDHDASAKSVLPAGGELTLSPGDWPAFRGPNRDNRVVGVRIKTDWNKTPPKELWRHLIGPGWSSFSVIGDHLYTQEQRGDDEYVVCYDATNGKEIWSHHNAARFEEAIAGPGPRATPTFDSGRLYVLGASGTIDCLQAATGAPIWSHSIVADTGANLPMWGFASSPLVSHGIVSVYAGGPAGKAVVAYQADSGKLAWTAGNGLLSYSSPQLVTIDGTEQILMATNAGLSAIEPVAGKILWNYDWSVGQVARIVQPTLVGACELLVGTGMGQGTRLINVSHEGGKWSSKKKWATKKFKPYYNDFVVCDDCIYGIDGGAFMCISMKDQATKWRSSDYGAGQVLLLADQKLLVILSEKGEVALVKAQPEKREELCKFKAIEGKTWNHPVIAHEKLFVRNGEEVACFKLEME